MASPSPRAQAGHSAFDAVVFSGGGCRCFWQLGFWTEAAPTLDLAPQVVAGVSAGSGMACAALMDAAEDLLADFKDRVAANERNVYPANALRGEPVYPHERIYRDTIRAVVTEERLAQLHAGPDVRVLLGRPPEWAGGAATLALGFVGRQAERRLGGGVHATWGRRMGFRPEVVSVRSCETPEALADLVMHSSCTPPAMPLYRRGARPVLDGGIVDGVPTEAAEPARQMLVLLSRHRPEAELPRAPGRHYVAPSQPLPIETWDYTNPAGVQRAFDLGRRDAERATRRLHRAA